MDFEKALTIFGLTRNYTEEQLKKRYHEFVKENHPDYHMDASEQEQIEYNRKLQEINEAHDVLKKNLNRANNSTYQGYSTQHYDGQKELSILQKLRSYYKQCDANKLMEQILNLIIKYTLISKITSNVDYVFTNFKKELESTYKNYIQIYCQKHKIPSFIMKEQKFKYDCDCATLYFQLKDCEQIIELDISKIIRKYQEHKHFHKLEKEMRLERDKYREKIDFNTTKSKYANLLAEYEQTIDRLISNYDDTSKKGYSSSTIPKDKNMIFIGLKKRYLSNCDNEKVEIINQLFIKAAELLYSENSSRELINEIDHITFKNPAEEYDRLIKLSTNKVKTFNEFLCVKKDCRELDFNIHKAVIVSSKQNNYYRVKHIGAKAEVIEEKDFEEQYINIDEVLSDAIFLGYKQESYPYAEVLYHNPNYDITIIRFPTEKIFAIVQDFPLNGSFKRNQNTDVYKNKVYLKEELSKYFDGVYKKRNTNKHTKSK